MGTKLIFSLVLILVPMLAFGHSGGQDKNGGHFDRHSETYHCHSKACKAQHKQSKTAQKEATAEGRQFSLVYNRADWNHWSDLDSDCQDSRIETLVSHSLIPVLFQGGDQCKKVISGKWYGAYTGRFFTEAEKLDIDHRIALQEAHKMGAANWTKEQKRQFANDPINLIPVYLSANRSKGSKFAYQWMPTNKAYWCKYIVMREIVVEKYNLTAPEKEIAHNKVVKTKYCN